MRLVVWWVMGSDILLLLLAVPGLRLSPWRGGKILLVGLLLWHLFFYCFFGLPNTRYRLPVIPFLIIFASWSYPLPLPATGG